MTMASSDQQSKKGYRSSSPLAPDTENPSCSKQIPTTAADFTVTNLPRPTTVVVLASVGLFVFFAVYSLFFYFPESPGFTLASVSIEGLNSSAIDRNYGLVKSSMQASFKIWKGETAEFHIDRAEVTVAYGRKVRLAKSFQPAKLRMGTWDREAELKMELDMSAFKDVSVAKKMIGDYRKNKRRTVGIQLLLRIRSRFSTGGGRMKIINYYVFCLNVNLVFEGSNGRLTSPDPICKVHEERLF